MTIGVAVVGCGLIGRRRAEVASRHAGSALRCVVDIDAVAATNAACDFDTVSLSDWHDAIARDDVQAVVVSTANASLAPIAVAALEAGKHVLLEKPMGRNLAEARAIAAAAEASSRLVKVGFNHRYHPAISAAQQLIASAALGHIINLRAVYGHGGRPGYEREWRGDAELAGGGEATDQGVHIFDLMHWFAGLPLEAMAYVQRAVWPIEPLEDNAFGLFRFASGAVASFHTSWTQWKNRFLFEVFAEHGSIAVEGLGKSYGPEQLVITRRNPRGGVPDVHVRRFDEVDSSWAREWDDFYAAVTSGHAYLGGPQDGVAAMAMLDAVYRSSVSHKAELVDAAPPSRLQIR